MKKKKHLKVAERILRINNFKTMKDNEVIYVYKKGVYLQDGEPLIKKLSRKYLKNNFSTHNVNEIINYIRYKTFVDRVKFNKDKDLINLENGIFDTQAFELLPHNPKILSTIKIPITYDSNAKCPKISKFFKTIMKKGDVKILQELFGYLLIPDYSIQKAFLFTGEGRNGKSTLIELIRRFVGNVNCSSVALQSLITNRFASASLYGKLINTYPDLSNQELKDTAIFKALTGGDNINAEEKFQKQFTFKNHARLIFSANTIPLTRDPSDAFFRRWIIIDFPFKFEEKKKNGVKKADTRILEKLTTEEELSGLLNFALKGLKRLLKSKTFSHKKSIAEISDQYQRLSNPVYAFIKNFCVEEQSGYIVKEDFYKRYSEFCKNVKKPVLSEKKLYGELTAIVPVDEGKVTVNCERKYAWKGMKWKRSAFKFRKQGKRGYG